MQHCYLKDYQQAQQTVFYDAKMFIWFLQAAESKVNWQNGRRQSFWKFSNILFAPESEKKRTFCL